MINKILHSRYKITEYIGCGGMAEVYKAEDMLLERDVAVKILRSQFSADENFIKKFKREAQSAGALNNDNIVAVFDVGEDDKIYYIVMEYIPGSTLHNIIKKEAPLDYDKVIFMARGIATALSEAHRQGIIHCDIKPHNILIDDNGNPKVSDFGIARAISSATMTFEGSILGSVHYLSPEQAKGDKVTYSSDLYSLGIVMFEMLTGTLPFSGDTPIAIAMQHVQQNPPVMRERNNNVPPILESIVSKMLSKKPEDRYLSADELIKDLDFAKSYLNGDSTLTNEDSTILLNTIIKNSPTGKENFITKVQHIWKKRWGKVLSIFLLLTLGYLVGMFMVFGQFSTAGEVKIPNLVGKEEEEIKNIIDKLNLKYEISEEFHSNVPIGFAISQNPEAGSIVKKERMVNVLISKGPELIEVPSLVGMKIDDIRALLAEKRIFLGNIEEVEDKSKEPGTILEQHPLPPAQVGINSYIDFVVATDVKHVVMPNLLGMSTSEAKRKLADNKLKLIDIEDFYTSSKASGTVVKQKPEAGEQIKENSDVVIVVARAVSEQQKQGIVEFVVPEGKKRQKIKIIVTDSRGRRTIYEEKHNPNERIRQTIDGIGSIRVQLYSNNKLVEEKLI